MPEEYPTTLPSLIYMITPSMVRSEGVNTPLKVPNFFVLTLSCLHIIIKYAKNELIFCVIII